MAGSTSPTGSLGLVGLVGLVVVSHSRALADAAVSLAAEMLSGAAVSIEIAAGLDDGSFGTDAVAIAAAIEQADSGAGVVVLMDLGSAVLSAQLALELLESGGAGVVLCPAPLVEGLVVAAVSAAGGATAADVASEARNSLLAKESQLATDSEPGFAPQSGGEPGPEIASSSEVAPTCAPTSTPGEASGHFTVRAEHGLHARPAAALVRLATDSGANVEFRNATTGSDWVSGASMMRVTLLGVLQGHQMDVRASGPDASAVVDQVLALALRDLGESG